MDRSFTKNLLWFCGIVGGILLLLYLFVFDVWLVPGDDPLVTVSILPTLKPDDRLLVRRGSVPQRWELARCLSPEPGTPYVVGRVVALGGERLEITNERATVAGKGEAGRFACDKVTVPHPVTQAETTLVCSAVDTGASTTYEVLSSAEYPEGTRSTQVEAGKLYLLSDNRHLHKDSRDFGPVDAATCEHIVFRLWGQSFTDGSRRFNLIW